MDKGKFALWAWVSQHMLPLNINFHDFCLEREHCVKKLQRNKRILEESL